MTGGSIMCLAIPGRIVELFDDNEPYAMIDISGVRRKINIGLLKEEGVSLEDWVLIHVGFAMNKISAEEAEIQLDLLEQLGEVEEAQEEIQGYQFE